MDKMKFEEIQQFRQKGLFTIYFILFALLMLFIYADVQQIILQQPFGSKPASSFVLIIITLFLIVMLVLFYKTKLETSITDEGVFFRWRPFRKAYTHFSWNYIDKAEIINYGFVGYGLRLTSFGIVHNVAGNKGLRLILKSGKKLILGTQKPEELTKFLQQINKPG